MSEAVATEFLNDNFPQGRPVVRLVSMGIYRRFIPQLPLFVQYEQLPMTPA